MSQRYIFSLYSETLILRHHVELPEGSVKSGKTKNRRLVFLTALVSVVFRVKFTDYNNA